MGSATWGRQQRALALVSSLGADCLLTANPSTVTWLTGYSEAAEAGPDPYAVSPIALIAVGEPPTLVVAAEWVEAVAELGCAAAPCGGFTVDDMPAGEDLAAQIDSLVPGRVVATEGRFLPAIVADRLERVEASTQLTRLRETKDPDEVELIRAAIEVCDAGQAAVRAKLEPPISELELWSAAHVAMERAAGSRLAVVGDLISGPRSSGIRGDATSRTLSASDTLICDLLPRVRGYWGDSSSTLCCEPTRAVTRAWRRVRDALDRLVDAVRPGVVSGDLDSLARSWVDFPHHTGHGVGTSYHEEPRIVPGGRTVLVPGMVVALEPALYTDTFGVRLEVIVLVTDDGCDVLSTHELSL